MVLSATPPSFVSSANSLRLLSSPSSQWLMKMLNRTGPHTSPWGTPLVSCLQLDCRLLIWALWACPTMQPGFNPPHCLFPSTQLPLNLWGCHMGLCQKHYYSKRQPLLTHQASHLMGEGCMTHLTTANLVLRTLSNVLRIDTTTTIYKGCHCPENKCSVK